MSPAVTSVSLFARPILFFEFIAARVGFKPAIPTIPVITVSLLGRDATFKIPSSPHKTLQDVSDSLVLRSEYFVSSVVHTYSGKNFLA